MINDLAVSKICFIILLFLCYVGKISENVTNSEKFKSFKDTSELIVKINYRQQDTNIKI